MTVQCGKGLGKEVCGLVGRRSSKKASMFKAVETHGETCGFQRVGSQAPQGVLTWEGGSPYRESHSA